MTLKEIKTASLGDLHLAAGMAKLSQGDGPNFSRMLENRIEKLDAEIAKRNFDNLLTEQFVKDLAESHLEVWKERYFCKGRAAIKFDLEVNHDNSLEIECVEEQLGRELTNKEREIVGKKFIRAVLDLYCNGK